MDRAPQSFPAHPDALPAVLSCVDCCREDIDPDTLIRARIAVEELFMNFVRHARPQGEGESLQAWLEVSCAGGRMDLCFEDSASPFDPFAGLDSVLEALEQPLELRSEGGVGRLLIRQLADSASYSRSDGRNRIELLFAPRSRRWLANV
ncbi:MAG: ATP-binding protein [Propionivibrio sp.]|uniref:ATP-binding protein n=1 Tax=Candidatus Propionivibrio dominans TaxID=2954373 RepID=A0A9D7F6N2_9RHOO|nr:ATP-binding protein [Candidatus Propionivibrio dominans]MBL0168075.1 ATP-binding protein [Propionivibrio sp.]